MKHDYIGLAQKGLDEMKAAVANKQRSSGAMALCGVVTDQGNAWLSSNQACHAGLDLRYTKDLPNGKPVVVVSAIQKDRGLRPKKECIKFINWLINDSKAYSRLFIHKDADYVWENGFAVYAQYPSNLVVGSLILTRIMWEYTAILTAWNNFVEWGIDGDVALLLAHQYSVSGGKVAVSAKSGHCALASHNCNVATAKRMMEGKLNHAKDNYDKDANYNGGVHSCYGNGNSEEERIFKLSQNVAGKAEGVYNNPFKRAMGLINNGDAGGKARSMTKEQFVHGVKLWMEGK